MKKRLILLTLLALSTLRTPLEAADIGQSSVQAVDACEESGWGKWLTVSATLLAIAAIGIVIAEMDQGSSVPEPTSE